MKIIYGNSSQKSIGRNQRITNHERRKKRERNSTSTAKSTRTGSSLKEKREMTIAPVPAETEALSLQENAKSIPHEISLIQPTASLSTAPEGVASFPGEGEKKGVISDENQFQHTQLDDQDPETETETTFSTTQTLNMSTDAAPTSKTEQTASETNESSASQTPTSNESQEVLLSESRDRRIEMDTPDAEEDSPAKVETEGNSCEPEAASEASEEMTLQANRPENPDDSLAEVCTEEETSEQESDTKTESRSETPLGSIVFWNEEGTEAAPPSPYSSRSAEGRSALHHLNQILRNEVNVCEIILPNTTQSQTPMVIFLHAESSNKNSEA